MPRRNSGGKSTRPAPRRAPAAPALVRQAPAPAHQSESGGILYQNFLKESRFGGGNAIAHRVVDALFGRCTVQHENVVSTAPAPTASSSMGGPDVCSVHSKAFQDCINNY